MQTLAKNYRAEKKNIDEKQLWLPWVKKSFDKY